MTANLMAANSMAANSIVSISGLNKWYGDFHVLRDIDLKVKGGERIVICGPSGSGKSTMIRCINRLEDWQRGRIVVDGVELTEEPKRIVAVRRDVGMVFQHFNLFPHLTVLENCTLAPIWVRNIPQKDAEATAMKFLERVKIPHQASKYPGQMSGGQQQRVAIARALIADPSIIVADEPTGDLDRTTAEEILDLLDRLNRELGKTIVMVTHDPKSAGKAHRLIHLEKGVLAA